MGDHITSFQERQESSIYVEMDPKSKKLLGLCISLVTLL